MECKENFWDTLAEAEPKIKALLYDREEEQYNEANMLVNGIARKLNLNLGLQLFVDTRNGIKLQERKDHIELVVSPMVNRSRVAYVKALYDDHFGKLPAYWSVIKYQPWRLSDLYNLTMICPDKTTIDQNDFSFCAIRDAQSQKLDVCLFVSEDKAKYLVKKETQEINGKKRELYMPINHCIYTMLNAAVGEFHMLNTLRNMEIYVENTENLVQHPLHKMREEIMVIVNNPMSNIHTCSRCGHTNAHVKMMKCRCGKVFYCDAVCQRAHRAIHKSVCRSKVL